MVALSTWGCESGTIIRQAKPERWVVTYYGDLRTYMDTSNGNCYLTYSSGGLLQIDGKDCH